MNVIQLFPEDDVWEAPLDDKRRFHVLSEMAAIEDKCGSIGPSVYYLSRPDLESEGFVEAHPRYQALGAGRAYRLTEAGRKLVNGRNQ